MKKEFDCVELQHQGGQKVSLRLAGMTLDEKVAYWRERTSLLRERRTALLEQHRPAGDGS